jgi:hypothetical protein
VFWRRPRSWAPPELTATPQPASVTRVNIDGTVDVAFADCTGARENRVPRMHVRREVRCLPPPAAAVHCLAAQLAMLLLHCCNAALSVIAAAPFPSFSAVTHARICARATRVSVVLCPDAAEMG